MEPLIGVIALLIIWLYLRRRQAKRLELELEADRRQRRKAAAKTSYHAVSIRIDGSACEAAKALSGTRLLSNQAPMLPLPECDAAECNCRFAHHDDRRSGKDRRTPFGSGGMAAATGRYEQERRQGSDRRRRAESEEFF